MAFGGQAMSHGGEVAESVMGEEKESAYPEYVCALVTVYRV